jgi:integrase
MKFVHCRKRDRRLAPGEEAKLLNAADEYMRDVIETALATGMRRGEIRSLQWSQVEGLFVNERNEVIWQPRAVLLLPWYKTKTRTPRRIPIAARLKPILARRRFDPSGSPMPLGAYVFGSDIGERVVNVTFTYRWHVVLLKANGFKSVYKAGALRPECRAALKQIDLHFHDLRREAASRWLEYGTPIHTVRHWLGHSTLSQTSTYLASSLEAEDAAMRRFDEARGYE